LPESAPIFNAVRRRRVEPTSVAAATSDAPGDNAFHLRAYPSRTTDAIAWCSVWLSVTRAAVTPRRVASSLAGPEKTRNGSPLGFLRVSMLAPTHRFADPGAERFRNSHVCSETRSQMSRREFSG